MNALTAPTTFWGKVRIIGPGLVWAVAAIGSGELIITAKTGAEYGLLFLWALWAGIWIKFWIQRGILDLTILTGKPVLELWHEGRFGKLSSVYWFLFFILTATGVAGLIGLSASVLGLLLPFRSVNAWAVVTTISIIGIAYTQRYASFEKVMLLLCLVLGAGTLVTLFFSQPAPADLVTWGLPVTTAAALIMLSLLGWGAGSGPDLMLPYSWWVAEKGYQNLAVRGRSEGKPLMELTDPESVSEVRSWLRIAKWDSVIGYVITGFVASVFMIAGAEILQPRGIVVEGIEVLKNLSTIFTSTFGGWSYLVFMIPAFAALYSTALGVFDGGRLALAHLARLLLGKPALPIESVRTDWWYRIALILFSLIPLILFLGVQRPVLLVLIAGAVSAISMPLLAFQVFWSLRTHVPQEYRPGMFYMGNLIVGIAVYLFFMAQALYQLF